MNRLQRNLATGIWLLLFATGAASAEETYELDIADQELSSALKTFAEQSGLQVVYFADLANGKQAKGVHGTYSADAALTELLDDTDLTYSTVDDRTYAISGAPAAEDAGGDSDLGNGRTAGATPRPVMVAQAAVEQSQASRRTETNSEKDEIKRPLEEIVVTGTLIRGAKPVGAPLISIDRDEIKKSGLSTVAQILLALPQSLGSGANEIATSISGTPGRSQFNTGRGSGVNLRGLGTDQTLTLINGRRGAPSGETGDFVDVSLIPLTAIERIEVLTDGASALYGSDAIGGVVNLVLQKNYDGAETRARFGAVTDGGQQEYQVGQAIGRSWEGGSTFIAYEYFKQDLLLSEDRAFAVNSDLTPFGGDNFGLVGGSPGTIFAGGQTFAIPMGQSGTALTPADFASGTMNFSNQRVGTSLLPAQERHSVFATASQGITDDFQVFVEGRYSKREFEQRGGAPRIDVIVPSSNAFFVDPVGGLSSVRVRSDFIDDFGSQLLFGDVESYGGTGGVDIGWGDWRVELFGSYNHEKTTTNAANLPNTPRLNAALADSDSLTAFNPFSDGSNTNPATLESILAGFVNREINSELWSINGKADGSLFALPGGDVKLALGVAYREEQLAEEELRFLDEPIVTPTGPISFGRRIAATFAELRIPLVGEPNRRPGIYALELSAAARYEHYDDFGDTTNPKFGALWSPYQDLKIRGTYGTSFRAPLLVELSDADAQVFAFPIPDSRSPTGFSNALIPVGGNPSLQPQEATTWTVGFDYSPQWMTGLTASLTYFNIQLENRILRLVSIFDALGREDELKNLVVRNPDPVLIQQFLNDPAFVDLGFGFTAADIDLLIDFRLNNSATTDVDGLDFSLQYGIETQKVGDFNFGVDGSYVMNFEEASSPLSAEIETVDTFYRQVDLRWRANASWNYDGFVASVFVNYTDDYTDNISIPNRKIGSWSTVDVTLAYNTASRPASSWLRNIRASVSAINILDEDPPFANNPIGVGFDPVNSNPRGRFIAFEMSKQWW